jgi:transcription termination factor NusB
VLLPIYEEKLNPPDRGLCHELVLGVLRRQIYLDEVVRHYAGSKKLDTAVRIALRLGAYQILFLEKFQAIQRSMKASISSRRRERLRRRLS